MSEIRYCHGAGMLVWDQDTYITDDYGNMIGWFDLDMDQTVFSGAEFCYVI